MPYSTYSKKSYYLNIAYSLSNIISHLVSSWFFFEGDILIKSLLVDHFPVFYISRLAQNLFFRVELQLNSQSTPTYSAPFLSIFSYIIITFLKIFIRTSHFYALFRFIWINLVVIPKTPKPRGGFNYWNKLLAI